MEDFVGNLGIPAEGPEAGDLPFRPESVFLLQPDGTADPFYQIGLIRLPAPGGAEEPDPVPVILITRVQGKILAAIPFSFWQRSVARRKLPPQSFSKAASVSVGSVLDVDREVPIEGTYIKIWIGFLSEELIQCLDFVSVQSAELEDAFLTEQEVGEHVPLAEALQTVADEKFSFLSAESGGPDLGKSSQEKRIARVEEALVEMKALLHQFAQTKARPQSPAPAAKARVTFKPPTQIPPENPIAGLDPHVVQSALRAGVSQVQLEELGRMLTGKKPDLADVARPSALRKPARLDVLGESDEEGEAPTEPGGELKPSAEELENPMQSSLLKLTSILEHLTSPTEKRRSLQDTLDDSVGHGEVSSTSSSSGHGRRHAAVLQTLRKAMRDCPEELYGVLEKNTLHDCGAPELGPGLGIMTATFRGWAEHRSRVPNIQGTVRTLWAMWSSRLSMLFDRIALRRQRLG